VVKPLLFYLKASKKLLISALVTITRMEGGAY